MINDAIINKIKEAKKEGKIVGLVQGSWDMFHLGHLCYLKEARKLCDFLVVAMDDDEKIKHRKGNNRPIIPLEERYKMIEELNIADVIIAKGLQEPKWGLIKTIKPDVLVAIKENYTDEQIVSLGEYCGRVAILPRQATTSTSDIIRRTLIKNGVKLPNKNDPKIAEAVEKFKQKINYTNDMPEPIPGLIKYLNKSTDWVTQVSACCFVNDRWYFGANQIDQSLSPKDINERTELFYAATEHAEINMLKQIGEIDRINSPVWTTLFPCDKCMKVLIDKGVKEIYYIEDHPEKNWSKRSHALAEKKGIIVKNIFENYINVPNETISTSNEVYDENQVYKYIDPRNVRYAEQLAIMLKKEADGKDPLDPKCINQEILFSTNYWYVSRNKFPYDEIEYQFLIAAVNPIYKIDDMPDQMWNELRFVWYKLIKEYNIQGGALCYRFGDTLLSGASLKRLHAHLIVPREENKTKFTIGGNKVLKKDFRLNINNQKDDENK